MKIKYRILITFFIIILGIYYGLSLLLMNNNPYVLHYYKPYDNIAEANKNGYLLNKNVKYELKGFTKEQEKRIKENVIIYTTKSYYEEFYGFLVKIKNEDKGMLRVNLEANKNIDELPDFLINKEIHIDKNNEGSLTYSSFDISKKEKQIKLDVIEYQNHQPIKLGEININLK